MFKLNQIYLYVSFILLFSVIIFYNVLFRVFVNQEKWVTGSKLTLGFYHKVSKLISKFVLMPHDQNSNLLFELLETLKGKLQTKNYKYELPWCLVLEDSESGQVKNIGLSINQVRVMRLLEQSLFVTYLSSGVLVQAANFDSQVEDFCELVANHKSALPFDSIAPLISLFQISNCSNDALCLLAKSWANKISNVYKRTNNVAPIYIIFDDLEKLEDFQTFANLLSKTLQQQILGYCCSNQALPPNFAQVVFDQITEDLITVQEALLSQTITSEAAAGLLRFMQNFLHIKDKCVFFLSQLTLELLRINAPIKGIYLTAEYQDQSLFTSALFEKKMFVERGLCKQQNNMLKTKNYWLKLTQISTIIIIAFLAYQLFDNRKQLIVARHNLRPKLQSLQSLATKYSTNQVEEIEHLDDLQLLLTNLHLIDYNQLFFPSIPSCYLSGLWHKKDQVLASVCEKLILNQLIKFLNQRIDNLGKQEKTTSHDWLLEHSPHFIALDNFIKQLSLLYKTCIELQSLQYDDNIKSFSSMISKFYGVNLSPLIVSSNKPWVYMQALHTRVTSPVEWSKLENQLLKIWFEKTKPVIELFGQKNILSKLDDVAEQLTRLSDKKVDAAKIQYSINSMLNWIEYEAADMFRKNRAEIGENWEEFKLNLDIIKPIIGKSRIEEFYKDLNDNFTKAKQTLLTTSLPILDYLIIQDAQGNLHACPKLFSLASLIKLLVPVQMSEQVKVSNFLICNSSVLNEVANKVDIFNNLLQTENKEHLSKLLGHVILNQITSAKKVDNIHSNQIAGYLVKIFAYAKDNDQELYSTLARCFINTCLKQAQKLRDLILDAKIYDLRYENRYDLKQLSNVREFFEKNHLQLKQFFENISDMLETYKALQEDDNRNLHALKYKKISNSIIDELVYVWEQIKDFDNNKGDEVLLHKSVYDLIGAEGDKLKNAQWQGKNGFFKIRFEWALMAINQTHKNTNLNQFLNDSSEFFNMFDGTLSNAFPFQTSGEDASGESVVRAYGLLDKILEKYPKQHVREQLFDKLKAIRPWLEALTGTKDGSVKLKFNSNSKASNLDQVTQITVCLDKQKIDFRSGEIEVKLPIDNIDIAIQLSASSDLVFENQSKNCKLNYSGQWAILRLAALNKIQNEKIIISLPVINVKTKEKDKLSFAITLECGKNKLNMFNA